jgi:hypothetical protein
VTHAAADPGGAVELAWFTLLPLQFESTVFKWLTDSKMGKDLSKSDLTTRMYTLGILYEIMRDLRNRAESLQRFEMSLMDVSARLEDTFNLTCEQRVCYLSYFRHPLLSVSQANIRLIAMEIIFEPKHVSYMHIHLDVEVIVVYFVNRSILIIVLLMACTRQGSVKIRKISDSQTFTVTFDECNQVCMFWCAQWVS